MPGLKRRKRKRVSPDPSPATAGPAEAPVGGPAPAKRRKLAQPKSTPMEDEEEILAASSEDSEAEVSFKLTRESKKVILDQKQSNGRSATTDSSPPAAPRRSPNGFILPDPLPKGHRLIDNRGVEWRIGSSIGLGGFGEIYAARKVKKGNDNDSGGDGDNNRSEDYIVKVEPHTNGPLFVEIAFYLKAAKEDEIDSFRDKELGVDHLGVPHFVASGSLTFNEKRFRFLVLPRYGSDLQSIIDTSKSAFSTRTACDMSLQVLDSLEYIHSRGYIHKDVKGSNLLLSRGGGGGGNKQRLFLVDFGLCSKYLQHGGQLHKPYQQDRRWAHEGTLAYTSRDFHLGCFSRRGDVEVLFYNLIEWVGGRLPWDDLEDKVSPSVIQNMKVEAFKDPHTFLASCFPSAAATYPAVLTKFMRSVDALCFEERPDYAAMRDLLMEEVRAEADMEDGEDEVFVNLEISRPGSAGDGGPDKENCDPQIPSETPLSPSRQRPRLDESLSPSAFLEADDSRRHVSCGTYESSVSHMVRRECDESLRNPTPVMLDIIDKQKMRRRRGNSTPLRSGGGSAKKGKNGNRNMWRNLTPSPLTPAMRAVMEARSRRREEQAQEENSGKPAKSVPENSGNSGSSPASKSVPENGASPKKRSSPWSLRASSSSPMKAGSTPRRKLNFGKGPRMTSSGDLKDGNGCNGVGNGSGGGGVMTRSRTLPVLVQQQDKSSFTNKMYQVVSGFFSRHFLKK